MFHTRIPTLSYNPCVHQSSGFTVLSGRHHCCSSEIPTSPRQAVSVEDAQLVSKLILQNSTQRQQHKFLFFHISCIGNINIILLSIKNCFICSKVSSVKEDHLQPVNMVNHNENHYQKDRGSKTTGEFYCVPWWYDYSK